MTRDEIKAKLAAVIREHREDGLCEYDTAAAVLALCGPKPLVWVVSGTGLRTECGMYCIIETPGRSGYYRLLRAKFGTTYCGEFCGDNAEEAAQAAAQDHYEAAHWAQTPLGDL